MSLTISCPAQCVFLLPLSFPTQSKKACQCFLCLYPRGGGGGTRQSFRRGESAPRYNPLPFYIPFFTEKHPLLPICDLNIITTGKKHNNNNKNKIIIIIIIITIIITIIKEKINVQTTLLSYIFVSFQQITFKPCDLTNFKALFPANFTLILLWSSRPPATFASISLIITPQSTMIIAIVKQLHSITLPHRWLRICNNASKRSQAVWRVLFDKFLGSFNVMTYLAVFFAQIY